MGSYRIRTALITGLLGLGAFGSAGAGHAAAQQQNCTADDVGVALGDVDYQSRVSTAPIQITAGSGVSCTLHGHADGYQFADAAGDPLPTSPSAGIPDGPPVTVAPGSPAHIQLIWQSYPDGPKPPRPASLAFTLPGAIASSTITWTGGDVYGGGHLTHSGVQPGPDLPAR